MALKIHVSPPPWLRVSFSCQLKLLMFGLIFCPGGSDHRPPLLKLRRTGPPLPLTPPPNRRKRNVASPRRSALFSLRRRASSDVFRFPPFSFCSRSCPAFEKQTVCPSLSAVFFSPSGTYSSVRFFLFFIILRAVETLSGSFSDGAAKPCRSPPPFFSPRRNQKVRLLPSFSLAFCGVFALERENNVFFSPFLWSCGDLVLFLPLSG